MHVGFFRQVTGKTSKQQSDGTWRSVTAASVFKEGRVQTLGTYVNKNQVKVAEWVSLRLIP